MTASAPPPDRQVASRPPRLRLLTAMLRFPIQTQFLEDIGGSDSRCVVLKNMFDRLAEEVSSNPKFFEELAEDVRGECAKLGTGARFGRRRLAAAPPTR